MHVRERPFVLSSRDEKFHGEERSLGCTSLFQLRLPLPPSLDQDVLWVMQAFSERLSAPLTRLIMSG